MSSLQDEYYTQVDNIFNNIRPNRFGQQVPDPTPYEQADRQVAPAAWVQNASAADGTANVTIDANGITIINGALTLQDSFGVNVITGGGFGSSWLDFIDTHFYNGTFIVGDFSEIAVSEVSGGATSANYAASLSPHLPYFVCSVNTGGGTFARVADATAESGFSLRMTGTKTVEFYQDIPIKAGQAYAVLLNMACTNSTSSLKISSKTQFRDADHGAIGSEVSGIVSTISTPTVPYFTNWLHTTSIAPSNARYLRVKIRYERVTGSPSFWISRVFVEDQYTYSGAHVMDATGEPFSVKFPGDAGSRFKIVYQGGMVWDNIADGVTSTGLVTLDYDYLNGNHMMWGTGDLIDQDAAGIGRTRTTAVTVANNTWTKLTLSTSAWAGLASSNNPYAGNEVRVNADGIYLIVGRAGFTGSAGGTRRILACSFSNAATPSATPTTADEHEYVTAGNTFDIHGECVYIKKLFVNDTIALTCHQNSGGNLDVFDISLFVARLGV